MNKTNYIFIHENLIKIMNWNDKIVVVTGGNGFLGSRIVSYLKEKGTKKIIIPTSKTDDLRIRENCAKITNNTNIPWFRFSRSVISD